MPTASRRRLSTALVALGLIALAGCSDASEGGAGTAPPTITSDVPSPLPSSSPAVPTSSTAPSSAPPSSPSAPASSAPAGFGDLLLDADELPGFNDQFAWSEGRTRSSEPKAGVGTCERFPLTSIGATDVAYRSYSPPPRSVDSAEELVADFPDATTAQRAFSVLKSWRAKCRSRLKGKDVRQIGDLQDVAVGSGSGGWYLLVYGPAPGDPDAGVFDAQGMAVVGTRIAVVGLTSIGQDYDYPQGKEPMVGALQAAARKLAG
jgi:hypothetical protein